MKRALLILLAVWLVLPAHGAASYKHWRSSLKAANDARVKRDFQTARTILENAAAEAAELGPASSAENSTALTDVLMAAGQYAEVIAAADPALEKIGPKPVSKDLQIWRGVLISSKAWAYYRSGRFDDALTLAEQSRDVLEQVGGKYIAPLSLLHGMIAKIYESKKEYAKAESSYKAALKLAETHQSVIVPEFSGPQELFYEYRTPDFAAGILVNLVALGNLYQLQERWKDAEEFYNKGLKEAERSYGKKGQAIVIPLAGRARMFLKTNRREEFEKDTQRIYEVAAKGPGLQPYTIYPLWLKLGAEAKENNGAALAGTADKIATVFEVQNYDLKRMATGAEEAATTGGVVDWTRAAQIQQAIRGAALSKFPDPAKNGPILVEFALAAERGQQTNLARANYEAILQTQQRSADKALYIAAAGKVAEFLIGENKPAEALTVYQKVTAALREKYGDDSRVANAMDREADLMKQLGQTQAAAEMSAKASAVRTKAMLKR